MGLGVYGLGTRALRLLRCMEFMVRVLGAFSRVWGFGLLRFRMLRLLRSRVCGFGASLRV